MLSSVAGAAPAWQSSWRRRRSPSHRRRGPLSQQAVVHGVHDDVVVFVATIVRTPNAVVGGRCRARLAVQGGVAGLRAVAEEVVVAAAVVHGVHDDVVVFVATIVRTPNAVVGGRRRARLAVQGGVAGLRAVAEEVVVAAAVVHGVHDDVVVFVATIVRTPNAVVGGRRRARLAVQGGVAGLRAITEELRYRSRP